MDCMRGRLDSTSNRLILGGLREYIKRLVNADRILIIACGTSWHAGLVAEYFFEEFCIFQRRLSMLLNFATVIL